MPGSLHARIAWRTASTARGPGKAAAPRERDAAARHRRRAGSCDQGTRVAAEDKLDFVRREAAVSDRLHGAIEVERRIVAAEHEAIDAQDLGGHAYRSGMSG